MIETSAGRCGRMPGLGQIPAGVDQPGSTEVLSTGLGPRDGRSINGPGEASTSGSGPGPKGDPTRPASGKAAV